MEQILSLGTILKKDNDFLLCIQPRCDSVRLKKDSKFIFIQLLDPDNRFDLVLPIQGDFKKLRISYNTDNYTILSFQPENEIVISKIKNGKLIFTDSGQVEYEFVANLKFQFAQRISNKFANEMSRVGLNESEWLRRNADS